MIPVLVRRRTFAAVLACLGLLLIGWSGLLVPSLSREVEAAFGQTDVGLGEFYFVTAAVYAVGSLGGGFATERFGRRSVLVLAFCIHAAGLVGLGIAPGWAAFVVAGLLRSMGAGAIDGGLNGLIVDLYDRSRGRILALAHLFYALGAVGAPILLAFREPLGLSWQAVAVATGLVAVPLVALLAVTYLADGRHQAASAASGAASMLALPLVVLAVAIGCYVTCSNGVSSWLVRFLAAAPAGVATSALGLFWAGLVAGRIAAALTADRFDHLKLVTAAAAATAAGIVAAVLVPSLEASIALFALAGFTAGPVYPLIMAIGGERFPTRAAAMSGILTAAGVVGTLSYPPLMGVISVTVGLPVAMLGTAVFGAGAAIALLVLGRMAASAAAEPAASGS